MTRIQYELNQMKLVELPYQPIEGKTYSLFGNSNSTENYFNTIKELADEILSAYEIERVLETIRKYSSRKKYLKRLVAKQKSNLLISFCLNRIHNELEPFTKNTKEHLKNLSLTKLWDRRLSTTEEQYHLYMLEIELTNRKNRGLFLSCDRKISLQPYCLQDFSVSCKSVHTGIDYQCRFCSKHCFQNHASCIMKENNIEPFIWMGAGISKAAKDAYKSNKTFGIIGIACIPELTWGMRKCMKYNIPVIGIPLNANRCKRWFGEFYNNSVDLNELEKLISK